jgi:hypothetical protein
MLERHSDLKLLQFIKALTLLKDIAKLTSSVKNGRNVRTSSSLISHQTFLNCQSVDI